MTRFRLLTRLHDLFPVRAAYADGRGPCFWSVGLPLCSLLWSGLAGPGLIRFGLFLFWLGLGLFLLGLVCSFLAWFVLSMRPQRALVPRLCSSCLRGRSRAESFCLGRFFRSSLAWFRLAGLGRVRSVSAWPVSSWIGFGLVLLAEPGLSLSCAFCAISVSFFAFSTFELVVCGVG